MQEDQRQFYEKADNYFKVLKEASREYFDEYLAYVEYNITSKGTMLDIGCGTGQSTYYLSGLGYSVCGLDGCVRFIKHARAKYPDLRFIEAQSEQLPFSDNSFDVVSSYNTIEHFSEAEKSIKEMIRVVEPGGSIVINSPNLLSLRHVTNAFLREKGVTFEGKKSWFKLIYIFFRNIFWIMKKKIKKKPDFSYRVPSGRYDYPDNDAVFYTNPVDLKKFFINNGCRIISYQSLNHIKEKKSKVVLIMAWLLPDLMGITRLVAKKL